MRRIFFKSNLYFPLGIGGFLFVDFYQRAKDQVWMFEHPNTKDRIRGEYENKIRKSSPPEKIFEVFATINEENELFMSHYDLFKAISPYTYSTKQVEDEEQKYKSEALSNFADVDEDGKISLYEYFLVLCLIQISRQELKEWFKGKNLKEGKIEREHLIQFYTFLRERSRVKLTITSMPDPRKVALNKEQYESTLNSLIDNLYKKYPQLNISQFLQLRESLLKDVYKFEFETFPLNEEGKISGEDFAKSLICYMDSKLIQKYFKKLDQNNFEGQISFDEYYLFQKFLQENQQSLNTVIEEKGVITKKKLSKLIETYQKNLGIQYNKNMIDIFIQVLDWNNNKKIDAEEFTGIVSQRSYYGAGETNSLQQPFVGFKEQLFKVINKAERIWDIINE